MYCGALGDVNCREIGAGGRTKGTRRDVAGMQETDKRETTTENAENA